jgi:hypothetical protein
MSQYVGGINIDAGENGQDGYICLVGHTGHNTALADARLIAAAPSMLAALKTAEQMVAEGRYDEAEDILHIAVSKAEGRTDA